MLAPLVFGVPGMFAECMMNGTCQRYGTLIKNGTGQIIGHIQESGVINKVIGVAPSFLPPPFNLALEGVNIASHAFSNVQIHRLDAKVQQVMTMVDSLKSLSFLNIGVSTLGIGVSVAGFILMNQKLNAINEKVDLLTSRIEQGFLKLHQALIRQHISALRGLLRAADIAHESINAEIEYRRLAQLFDAEYSIFFGEIEFALKQEQLRLVEIEQLIQLMVVAHNAKIRCLILANELSLAKSASEQNAQSFVDLFDPIDIVELTHKILAGSNNKNKDFMKTFSDTLHGNDQLIGTKDFIANMREVSAVASTKSFLIDKLIKDEVPGKLFFDQLSHQKEPIVVISN